jgi:hypothetical protein
MASCHAFDRVQGVVSHLVSCVAALWVKLKKRTTSSHAVIAPSDDQEHSHDEDRSARGRHACARRSARAAAHFARAFVPTASPRHRQASSSSRHHQQEPAHWRCGSGSGSAGGGRAVGRQRRASERSGGGVDSAAVTTQLSGAAGCQRSCPWHDSGPGVGAALARAAPASRAPAAPTAAC